MQRETGVETGWLSEEEIASMLTCIEPEGVGGIVHEPHGGYADPVWATLQTVETFEAAGGDVFLRFKTSSRQLEAVGRL